MGRWDYWHAPLLAFAWFAVAMGLPYLLVGPLAGSLIGRTDTRTALIASNLERGLANILFVLAPNRLLVLIALRSSADTFFTPAK